MCSFDKIGANMALDKEQLNHLGRLAAIELDEQSTDTESLCQQISDILTMVDSLKQVDTHNIKPLAHPLELSQPLRADEVTEFNQIDDIQSNAPLKEDNVFLVPKVIDIE